MSKETFKQSEETTFSQTKEEKYTQTQAKKKYQIMFKENRSFELYVGRGYYPFQPHQAIEVDEDFLNHPDFVQQKQFFAVREIK